MKIRPSSLLSLLTPAYAVTVSDPGAVGNVTRLGRWLGKVCNSHSFVDISMNTQINPEHSDTQTNPEHSDTQTNPEHSD